MSSGIRPRTGAVLPGILALILGKHPGMTPYELKTVLRATASTLEPDAGEAA